MNCVDPPWACPSARSAEGGGETGYGAGQTIGNDGTQNQRLRRRGPSPTRDARSVAIRQTGGNPGTAKQGA